MDTERGVLNSGVYWGEKGRASGREWGGIMWEEISVIGDVGMVTANHLAMNVPMQQSCMFCICTPESKVNVF